MPVRSVADWLKRRAEILAGMQAVMGRLPGREKRCPLDMKVEEEVDCGTLCAAVDHLCVGTGMPRPGVPADPQIRAAR